jgi:hypothetical protein
LSWHYQPCTMAPGGDLAKVFPAVCVMNHC